jgi:uncharacterized protein (TIGR02099 family)
VSATPGRGGSARPWRILAGTAAGLLILAALLLGALRLAISLVPENAARIQAWVERQTDYRLEFRGIDARMRWWGPEVVLRNVRVLDPDASQALFETGEAAVSLDLWNLFRTGELVAGRVRIVGPAITVVRLADGRIRLLGQRERPADRPPFDLDRLPAGRLEIEDATVIYRDLRTGRGPWTLQRVQVSLRRAHDAVDVTASLRLPEEIGSDVDLTGRLHGSLDHFEDLELRIEATFERLRLAGLAELLPAGRVRPVGGAGRVEAAVEFDRGRLGQLKLDLDLADVQLALPARSVPPVEAFELAAPARLPGSSPLSMPLAQKTDVLRPGAELPEQVRYASLQGRLRLRRNQDMWFFRASDLQLARNDSRPARSSSLAARWQGHPSSAFSLAAHATDVEAGDVWPLVLAVAPGSFDRWAGLDPRGTLRQLRAEIVRERAGSEPRFAVSADVANLGVRPAGRWPGVSGVTARLSGTEERGRIALRAGQPAFEWPRRFPEPLTVARVEGDIDWQRDGRAWILQSPRIVVDDPRVAGDCSIKLRLPGGGQSPWLDLDARVERGDATLTPHVIPYGQMQPGSIAWLLMAFQKGSVSDGRVAYHGPTRKFPFRDGEGEFLATAVVRDATLTYFDGFAPLVNGVGDVEFHNEGLKAHLSSGEVGGLRVGEVQFAIPDLKSPDIEVNAEATGDLAKALAVVQASPLGQVLGEQFMQLAGRGPADYVFSLRLPSADHSAYDYRVRTRLRSVSVDWPVLRAPATQVTGDFEIHNREFRASSLRGVFLDGPFEGSVRPGPVGGDVSASILFSGSGRAAGALLPAMIGLPDTIRMSGSADWRINGRIERRGDGAHWPVSLDIASDLRGLGIDAPRPFAKEPPEPRATRVQLDLPATGRNEVRIDSGTARAALVFVARGAEHWNLERGAARFDGRGLVLPDEPGLRVVGDWPEFDLAQWLALRPAKAGEGALSDWLGPVDVHLERARVFGFEFSDVSAHVIPGRAQWRVDVAGPMAEGAVTIPADFSGTDPLRLEMRRLELRSGPVRQGAAAAQESDPRDLPAIAAAVDEFAWQDRHFGRLVAQIDRVPQGLRLSRLATESKSFRLDGTGSWFAEDHGSRTRLALELWSTNLATTVRALGYPDVVDAKKAHATASLTWSGGPAEDAIARMDGSLRLELDDGQLRGVEPGAGRVLGLMSVLELPRRLTLDFRDVTQEGLAFDKVRGDFDVRAGNAYTQNLLLKGPAVDVGVVGRTGLAAQDYDQTVVVSGNTSGPITVAGALAGGPVGAAGALLISQIFKGQLQGLTRMYYRITGPWSDPKVERISASVGTAAPTAEPAPAAVKEEERKQ